MKTLTLAIALSIFCSQYPSLGHATTHKYARPRTDGFESLSATPKKTIECAKMCEADTSPCDGPLYKKVDGRCSG